MTMLRFPLMLIVASLTFASFACDKKPQQPRQEAPAEAGDEQAQPDASAADEADGEVQAGQGEDAGNEAAQADACPEARDPQGMCAQVITWAKNPDTGECCEYASPCVAPQDWQTFSNEGDCAQANGQPDEQ